MKILSIQPQSRWRQRGFLLNPFRFAAPRVYATWDATTQSGNFTLTNGNLTSQLSSAVGAWRSIRATIGLTSGKWYWEIHSDSGGLNEQIFGAGRSTLSQTSFVGSGANDWGWQASGVGPLKWNNGSSNSFGVSIGNGDVLQIALDMTAGKIWVGKNNTFSGSPAAGTGEMFNGLSGIVYPALGYFNNGRVTTANFGATTMAYAPPSGFNAGVYI